MDLRIAHASPGGFAPEPFLRRILHLLLILASAGLVGCAPFYPTLKREAADSSCPVPTNVAAVDYKCISDSIDEMEGLLETAGTYERTLGYTAVGGGTYAAYEASKKTVNNALLKHAAIGLGAMIGLNQVVAPEKQQDVLVAGIQALRCVEKAAHALEYAGVNARNRNAGLADSIAEHSRIANARYGAAGAPLSGTISVLVTNMLHSEAAVAKAAADAHAQAGVAVRDSVMSIRDNVRTQLVTNKPDLKQLFENQQTQVTALIGGIVKADAAHKEDKARVQLMTGITAEDVVSDPAKPAEDAFSACVAPTIPGS